MKIVYVKFFYKNLFSKWWRGSFINVPKGYAFPKNFFPMVSDGSIIWSVPVPLLTKDIDGYGIVSILQHIRSQVIASAYTTATDSHYILFSYDTLWNINTNYQDITIILNWGLTPIVNNQSRLSSRIKNGPALE